MKKLSSENVQLFLYAAVLCAVCGGFAGYGVY